jgi:hypothetical protein
MFQVDPWEKAADCERALRLAIDPVHRERLVNIREFWISLADEKPFLSEDEFAKQVEAIGRLHADLTATRSIHSYSTSRGPLHLAASSQYLA